MDNLLNKYFNSTLRPDEFQEITDFILDKKNEKVIFHEMEQMWSKNLQNIEFPEPNSLLIQKIKEIIWQQERKTSQKKIKIYSWGLRIAAIFIIGLLFNVVFNFQKPVPIQDSGHIQTVAVPYGARTQITLPDGSKVWLNSGTTLSYSSLFDKTREVSLVGEAYFDVVKKDYPFIVSTLYGDVEVKGTSFNVKAFSDDGSYETTLVKGLVVVGNKDKDHEVTLHHGQQALQNNEGFVVNNVETRLYTSWKEGELIFSKEPFPSFIRKLERWYNVKIEYDDPKLDQLWYTGTLQMETISEVMEMVSKASPVEYKFNNKTRVFTIKPKRN